MGTQRDSGGAAKPDDVLNVEVAPVTLEVFDDQAAVVRMRGERMGAVTGDQCAGRRIPP